MSDNQEKDEGSVLLSIIQAIAISPEKAKKVVAQYHTAVRRRNPKADDAEVEQIVSNKIIKKYSSYASLSGGISAPPGVIPGVGTLAALFGGGAADLTACMKIQIDITMLLATNFGWDLTDHDALYMTMLIAVAGGVEKMGTGIGVPIASKAGVRLLRQYLRGAALASVKEFFKLFGVLFTREALEKGIPFGVGVITGSGLNYALTRYVGYEAVKCFTIERQMRQHPEPEEWEGPTDAQAA